MWVRKNDYQCYKIAFHHLFTTTLYVYRGNTDVGVMKLDGNHTYWPSRLK